MQKTKPTELLAGRDHIVVGRFRLRVVAGPDKGRSYASDKQRVVIGTHRSSDFILRDTTMSRFHCEVVLRDGKAVLRDLGSLNGTEVDEVAIDCAYLRHRQTLTLGRTRLAFEIGDESTTIPISDRERAGLLIGRSDAMRAVFAVLERAAQSDATVLLQGETGTGKDLAAESIHQLGPRKAGPFVVVDCGAITPNLIESELLGHERGAFTGADHTKIGAFEAATGGTIFLDEIGELPLDVQPKLLRVLEQKHVQRIGGTRRIPVDVRIIAATNRNLREEVNRKRFRSDLYYRIAVVDVRLPPLRERPEDIPLLIEEFVSSLGRSDDSPGAAELRSPELVKRLQSHAWPGNVRELRNQIERTLTLHDTPGAPPSEIQNALEIDTREPFRKVQERWMRNFERRFLERLLQEHNHNVVEAAKAAQIPRATLYRMMARCGIR